MHRRALRRGHRQFRGHPGAPLLRESLRFRGSAWLDGEGFHPTLSYAAEVDAVVRYQDGVFTLSQIHLS